MLCIAVSILKQLDETADSNCDALRKREGIIADIEEVVCYLNDIYTSGNALHESLDTAV